MAEDTAALMEHLDLDRADVFGYSMGGGIALRLAVQRPKLVRKLVVASVFPSADGVSPEVTAGIQTITPDAFAGSPMEAADLAVAPNPDDWSTLIEKVKQPDADAYAVRPQQIRAIAAPALLIIGDSDIVRPEHAVELLRLLGGGVPGDLTGLPTSRLAILPGTSHTGSWSGSTGRGR